MPTVEFMGKEFTVDEDGFIDSYENWCDEWVQWVKKEEGIDSTVHRVFPGGVGDVMTPRTTSGAVQRSHC